MEQRRQSFFSADDANYLAQAEAADRANEYLYRVLDIGQYMLQSGAEISRGRTVSADFAPPSVRSALMCSPLPPALL